MTPQISIIVPVYNVEKYLHQCINSILTQTFQNFELLLIDDGSPDKSGKICDEYAKTDNRIRVFHKENGGVTSARKYGIEKSYGEWIMLVDSDDYIENNSLELLLSYSCKTDSELIIGHYRYVDEDYKTIEIKKNHSEGNTPTDVLKAVLKNQCTGSLCSRLIRKELFNNIYYPPRDINMGEDIICGIQLISNARKITICPDVIYNYLQQKTSITHNLNSKTVRNMPNFIKWVHSYITTKHPLLNIFSSYFCIQQYYTYLSYGGTYSEEDFKQIYREGVLEKLNSKLLFLFRIYSLSTLLGNLFLKIIQLKKTLSIHY